MYDQIAAEHEYEEWCRITEPYTRPTVAAHAQDNTPAVSEDAEIIDAAKRYLKRIRRLDTKINRDIDELHRLKAKVTSITPMLKPDVVSGGGHQDKLAEAMAEIMDLNDHINREIDRFAEMREEIVSAIDDVEDDRLHRVLTLRYVSFKTFEWIACEMGYSYQQIWKIHKKALLTIGKKLKISGKIEIS